MKHAKVPVALDLVVEEVGKESQRIRDAGGEALKTWKLKPAKNDETDAYIEYCTRRLALKAWEMLNMGAVN